MPDSSGDTYDVDSLVERWEEKLVSVLRQNHDELLAKMQFMLEGYEESRRQNPATRQTSAVSSVQDLVPLKFSMNGSQLSYPSKADSDNESTQDQLREAATLETQSCQQDTVGTEEQPGRFDSDEVEVEVSEPQRGGSDDHRARLSMSSMTSHEEKSFRDNLKSLQKAQTVDLARSRSNLQLPPTLLGKVRDLVQSWRFEAFFACAILSNSILIGVQVNDAALHPHKDSDKAYFWIEQVYAGIFLIEILLRITAEGRRFFCSSPDIGWNYLDVLIICTSVLTLVTELAEQSVDGSDGSLSGNVRIIRILRVTRVMRVVRIVKIVRFIRALRSLVHSIFSTMKVLMWSVLLLLIIIYVFAIVFTDVATSSVLEAHEDGQQDPALLRQHFNGLERSMQTLFHCISNGVTWGALSDTLNSVSRVWGYLLLLYISFCLFAVLNVMTAVFCQSAIESAERDQELIVQSVAATKQQQIEMFMSVFEGIQAERRGAGLGGTNVTFAEFEDLFNEPRIRTFFQSLDLETSDAWTLFKLMDTSGNGDLDATEFVEGCMRLKGPARSIDVAIMMQEHKRLRKKVMGMARAVSEMHAALVMSAHSQSKRQPSNGHLIPL